LRRGSMYENLTWENIDLTEKIAKVTETKNGDEIVVPLNADAVRALMIFRSRGDDAGRVVRNEAGEALTYNNFWFVPAVRAAESKTFDGTIAGTPMLVDCVNAEFRWGTSPNCWGIEASK
jgi:hypothetical protein